MYENRVDPRYRSRTIVTFFLIDESLNATIELYAKTKGKGQLEPRFWITKGKEIEAQANRQLRELERQQNLLNAQI
jgi:phosphoserine aminotransferase